MWLLSLCSGFGEAGLWDRRGDEQNKHFLLFFLFYQGRVGQLGFASRSALNRQGMRKMRLASKPSPEHRLCSLLGSVI